MPASRCSASCTAAPYSPPSARASSSTTVLDAGDLAMPLVARPPPCLTRVERAVLTPALRGGPQHEVQATLFGNFRNSCCSSVSIAARDPRPRRLGAQAHRHG